MDRFGRVLRRVESRLRAPEPERSRILMEIAGDLEEMYRSYRDQGLDEDEARKETERWLAPSATALASLHSVHLPAFERLLDRLGGTARGRTELGLVALLSLAAVGSGLAGVLRSETVPATSPGLWSVAVLVALGIGVGAREGYALFVRGDRLGPGWRDRLGRVLACAGGSALAGPLAAAIRLSLAVGPAGGGIPSSAPWSELAAASGLAALGLSGALLLALLWLLLRTRAASVLRARRELRQAVGPWEDTEPEETPADGAQYDHAFTDGALADDGLARRERNSGLERETTP